MTEQKRMRIPNAAEDFKAISVIKAETIKINNEIKDLQSFIEKEILKHKNDAEMQSLKDLKNDIYKEMDEIREKYKNKKQEKSDLFEEMKKIKASLAQNNKVPYSSLADFENEKKEIERNMIAKTLNTKQEKIYSDKLMDLKTKMKSFGNQECIQSKLTEIEAKFKKSKAEFDVIKKEHDELYEEYEELKKHIVNMKTNKGGLEAPVVVKSKEKIAALKAKRNELNIEQAAIQKIINQKTEEHKESLEKDSALAEYEDKKKKIQEEIKALEDQRAELVDKRGDSFNPRKFDHIIAAVKKLEDFNEVPFAIVQQLTENGIKIMHSKDDLERVVKLLEIKKTGYINTMRSTIKDVDHKINQIATDIKIKEEELENLTNNNPALAAVKEGIEIS